MDLGDFMSMSASRKKNSQGLQLDEIFLDKAQEQAGFWSDEMAARPVSSRKDIGEFATARARPANDDVRRPRRATQPFVGSRHFLLAFAAMLGVGLLFATLTGIASGAGLAGLLRDPARFAAVWAAIAVVAGIPWLVALSAHRQAASNDMLRRILMATQRIYEPNAIADDAGRRINASFDQMFADIDDRMAMLDARSAQLADQIAAAMYRSTEAADANITNMRSIVEASDIQREALQRTGMLISTEILPVIAKLETTVLSLEAVSQNAGGILNAVGGQLQQSTQELRTCLELFNSANHNVAPELERRMLRFEASLAQLPEQLDATIGRLSPLSETVADAAMLSAANIEVIDQLAKDITAALEHSRTVVSAIAPETATMFHEALDTHVAQFRDMAGTVVAQEASRVSALSRQLEELAGTASAVVGKLQQPVTLVTAAADQALASVSESMSGLDQRIEASIRTSIAELQTAAERIVIAVNREVEASAMGLQTRLAASSTELMQRVNSDTARFESLIGETAERTSGRLTEALQDLPSMLAQRVETEIAKVDGSLKGTILAISDQMRSAVDALPGRFNVLTRDTLAELEAGLERSFSEMAERSQGLSEEFRRTASETTDEVLQNYVDFIYLAVERFRSEMEQANRSFASDVAAKLPPLAIDTEVALSTEASADPAEIPADR